MIRIIPIVFGSFCFTLAAAALLSGLYGWIRFFKGDLGPELDYIGFDRALQDKKLAQITVIPTKWSTVLEQRLEVIRQDGTRAYVLLPPDGLRLERWRSYDVEIYHQQPYFWYTFFTGGPIITLATILPSWYVAFFILHDSFPKEVGWAGYFLYAAALLLWILLLSNVVLHAYGIWAHRLECKKREMSDTQFHREVAQGNIRAITLMQNDPHHGNWVEVIRHQGTTAFLVPPSKPFAWETLLSKSIFISESVVEDKRYRMLFRAIFWTWIAVVLGLAWLLNQR